MALKKNKTSAKGSKAQPIREIQDIHVPASAAKKRPFKLWQPKLIAKILKRLNHPRVRLALLIAVVLLGGLFVRSYMRTRDGLRDEATNLTSEIGKHLELPSGETPTIATVKDASKLKTQPFFARAQDGDKVLLYTQSGRAVLYRPLTEKVIEYSPISLGASDSGN